MEEKISVIVPVYNLEKEIAKCLMSLIFQKHQNYEIIVVDDGSTDNTAQILDCLKNKSDNIRIFHTKNHGLSAARNFGIKKATGKYISLVDGDDYVDPNFLSSLYAAVKEADAEIAICGYTDITTYNMKNSLPIKGTYTGKEAALRLLTRQENVEIIAWNKLYLKSLFRDIKYPDGENFEDNLTTYKLLAKAKKVVYTRATSYNHVYRAGSIMDSAKTEKRLSAKVKAAKNAMKEFKSDAELRDAAHYSLLLAYFQFVDYASRKQIASKNFISYRKKILDNKDAFLKNKYCDKKRRSYIALISPFSGLLYKTFRRF